MSGGGGSSQTQTTEPWEGQKFPLELGMQEAVDLYANFRPEFYEGPATAAFTQPQLASQQYLQDYAQSVQPLIGQGQEMAGFLAGGGAMDIANNPYVTGVGDVMTSQISDRLMSDVLPSIRSQYRPGQAFGGSRENLAVGRAVEGATQQMGDALTQLYGGAYGQGLQATGQAQQNLPMMAQLGAYPAQLLEDVGAQQRAYDQALINQQMAHHQFDMEQPYDRLNRLMGVAGGGTYGGQSTIPGSGSSTNPFAAALGGAATGAGIGSVVPIIGPGLGAGIGAGAGLLGSIF